MGYSDGEMQNFRRVFARRRRRQMVLMVGLLVAIFLVTALEEGQAVYGVPVVAAMRVAYLVIIGGVLFSWSNWRCPACGGRPGRTLNPRDCATCGTALR